MISLSGTGWLLGPLLGYLLGSIPFGLLIGMSRGVDVRNQGSGNIGSTNVGRVLGRQWGYLCFILDVVKGLGPVLQIAEGFTVDLPEELEEGIIQHSSRTWPSMWFVPRITGQGAFRDVFSVAKSWGSNRGVLSHGHIGADLLTLASILRIPVSMHNLERQALLRPSIWGNFGDQEFDGADYRACQALGPLYGDY